MKAQIAGKALVITSDITVKDMDRAASICPEALELKDKDSNVTFIVAKARRANDGDIGKYGIIFDSEGPDGKAQLTKILDKTLTKGQLADQYGAALIGLGDVEKKFATEFTAASKKLSDAISTVEGVE